MHEHEPSDEFSVSLWDIMDMCDTWAFCTDALPSLAST
jgi:hypothetical protein